MKKIVSVLVIAFLTVALIAPAVFSGRVIGYSSQVTISALSDSGVILAKTSSQLRYDGNYYYRISITCPSENSMITFKVVGDVVGSGVCVSGAYIPLPLVNPNAPENR